MSLEAMVKNLVVEVVHKVSPESSVHDAASLMLEKDISCLLVSGVEGPIGIITERDILRRVTAVRLDPGKVRVKDVMSSPLVSVDPETSVGDAAKKMIESEIKRLVVMSKDGAFMGLITMTDIVRWVARQEELSDSLLNYLNFGVP